MLCGPAAAYCSCSSIAAVLDGDRRRWLPPTPAVSRCRPRLRSGFNVHPVHEVITKGVDVIDMLVRQQRAVGRPDDLMDQHGPSTVLSQGDLDRLNTAVDRLPLAQPILPDGLTPRDATAFPAVGPVDVGGHGLQNGVDGPRVEGGIKRPDPLLRRHRPTLAIRGGGPRDRRAAS
jgi:hypothetical protein